MIKKKHVGYFFPLFIGLSFGCSTEQTINESVITKVDSAIVWAVNVGGEQYRSTDGIDFSADAPFINGSVGHVEQIKGSQDESIYLTYRQGNLAFNKPVENGLYDITFMFAEPEDLPVGSRIFNVFLENELVIDNLDIRGARDGKHISALDRTVYGVNVKDNNLSFKLDAIKGQPLLNAIVVRKPQKTAKQWTLVWQDEFSIDGRPDETKWSYDIWPAKKVNDEDQTYTDNEKNVRVENGSLVIEAHKEQVNDAEYSSGRIHSAGKGDFLYGRAEIRAKVPAGQGTWAAAWMLPSDPYKYATTCKENEDWQGSATCNAWPNSGEIDIMEHVGFDMQNVHGTVHNKAYYWAEWEQRKGSIEGQTVDTEFHDYAIEWTPEQITIFFDNTPYFTYTNEHTGWKAWPYDNPYHLILNLAIGGMWGRSGGPIDDSIFPVKMEVDYVRVYKQQ